MYFAHVWHSQSFLEFARVLDPGMEDDMAEGKKAAIDLDDIQDKNLDQVSAADFLTALNSSGATGAAVLRAWPEKKKYELLLEPEFNKGIKVGVLVGRLKEKKKFELEKPLPSEIYKNVGAEHEWIDPRQWVVDPVAIATEVARQLKGR
jgi:hypothetical protein